MPFVPKEPKRVDDLFTFIDVPGGSEPLLKATLIDGSRLCLTPGPNLNYPSPWPLYYEPYVWPLQAVVEWAGKARYEILGANRDIEHTLAAQWGPKGLGPHLKIEGLELGVQPALVFVPPLEWSVTSEIYRFTFPAPIVSFTPITVRF